MYATFNALQFDIDVFFLFFFLFLKGPLFKDQMHHKSLIQPIKVKLPILQVFKALTNQDNVTRSQRLETSGVLSTKSNNSTSS